jgi:3-hydroxy-9,10-secoandrosta-1,3,5(10)-triene-9,17-dione monooxygenase
MNDIQLQSCKGAPPMNMHVVPRMAAKDAKRIARSIIPELQKRAQQAEDNREVPKESMDLLKQHGLLTTIQPRSCGGQELTMRAHCDVLSSVAEGCAATAWVLGVMQAHSWMFGHATEQAQKDVFGDHGNHPVSAVIGPRGKAIKKADGSYSLSGFWPFASGNAHAQWLMLGAEIFDEQGAFVDIGDFLVEKKDLDVLDDWYVAGMQGSGSSSVKVKDLAIPAHRQVSLSTLLENTNHVYNDPDAPSLFKSQAGPVLGLCIMSGATGIARSALNEFTKMVQGKKVAYTAHTAHEWQPLQKICGEAASKIHAAELVMYKIADDIDDYAARGEKMPMELRARIRADIALVPRMCRDAVIDLLTIGGAAGLSLKSPIQLAARNLIANCMHGFLLYESGMEIYGRVMLGLDPGTPVI